MRSAACVDFSSAMLLFGSINQKRVQGSECLLKQVQPEKEAQDEEKDRHNLCTRKNTAVTAKGILLLRRIWKTALCVTLSIWRSAKGDDLSEKSYSFALDHEGKAHELLEIWKTEWRFFRFRNLKALLLQKLPTKTNLTNDYYSLKTCIYQK